jgi:hypothetical protein
MQTLTLIRVGTFAVALAAATWFGGWWTVPLMGSVHAFTARGATRPGLEAAIGAMLAWGALMVWQLSHPAFPRLQEALQGVFPLPPLALAGITVLLGGALAGASARLVSGLLQAPR